MRRLAALVLVVLPLALTGLAAAPASADLSRQERVTKAKDIALRQIGDRYRYGAEGPDRFDCSGLVWFSTHRAGFGKVPRTSAQQARSMRHVRRSAMRPGDFVFFRNGGGVYHVGIYLGRRNGRRTIVHAPSTGQRVQRDPIWTDHWFAGTLRRR
jgi:cell wall-associated NlpC family hydrolase